MKDFGKVLFIEGSVGLDGTTAEAYDMFENNERVILDDLYKNPDNLRYISEEIKPDTIMVDTTNFYALDVRQCKEVFRKINYKPINLIVGSFTAFETFEDIIVPLMKLGMKTFIADTTIKELSELDSNGEWLDRTVDELVIPDEFH